MTKKQNCLYQLIRKTLCERGINEKLNHTMETVQRVERIDDALRKLYPKGTMVFTTHHITANGFSLEGDVYECVIKQLLVWVIRDNLFSIRHGMSFNANCHFALTEPYWVISNIIPEYIRNYQN